LIIEFAKDLEAEGKSPMEAALAAAHLRFRPIIMTSLAFILAPCRWRSRAAPARRASRAIGTAVIGGMITAVALAVLFVPAFFVVVRKVFKKSKVKPHRGAPLTTTRHRPRRRRAHDERQEPETRRHAVGARRSLGARRLHELHPGLRAPAAPVAPAYAAELLPAGAAGTAAAADIEWQRFFTDARLRRLIEISLANNATCASRCSTSRRRAAYQVRRADELPSVGAGFTAQRAAGANGGLVNTYAVGLQVTATNSTSSAACGP